MTFANYYQQYYDRLVTHHRQPMLEAFPAKEGQQVFLVPEFCAHTGFTDEVREDETLMNETLKMGKVSPQERLNAISKLTSEMTQASSDGTPTVPTKILQDWKMQFDKNNVEVDARVLDPLEVCFGQEKQINIKNSNFQRSLRHGLQCPVHLDNWLFIYPNTDIPVLDIWLRSLRDIAQVAFTMKMGDPMQLSCKDQTKEIVELLETHLTPKTQLVLLLTPQSGAKRVYRLFKTTTITRLPCITQVVKSETIRRRTAIAAVLSRVVLQINAKFCGPLWHIDLMSEQTVPLVTAPTMFVGIYVFTTVEGNRCFGFAASLDTRATE